MNMLVSPAISVIMSIYNEPEEWLRESIESILNQTVKDFEFIIINDNPERESNNVILKEYQSKDNRIIIIANNENLGLTKSLNIGFKLAKGKYVARMDADDISDPKRLETQYQILENNQNIGLVGTLISQFEQNKKIKSSKVPITNDEIKSTLFFENCIAHPSVMLKRQIFNENEKPYNETFKSAQDYELWVRIANKSEIIIVNKKLLSYRVHINQITSSSRFNQDQFAFKVCLSQLQNLKIVPTEKEIEMHYMICVHRPITNKYSLSELECWLLKIKTQNELLNIFEPKIFNKIVSQKFIYIYYKYPDSLRNKMLYLRSKLIYNKYSLPLIIEFIKAKFC